MSEAMRDGMEAKPPGEYIRDELRRRSWTQDDLAHVLGRTPARVNQIITGKQELSPEIAVALETAFGTSAKVWLERESTYRLALLQTDTNDVRRRKRLYELAPIKEMQRRGWIQPNNDVDSIEQELMGFFATANLEGEPPIHGALRKSAPAVAPTPAQRAWAFRVRQLAAASPSASVNRYDESNIDACKSELRKLAAYSSEVRKAPAVLAHYGIRFVVVEGLSGAKIDGFATWLDEEKPVIGMSLRFDRLGSFWFTLGHELSHIKHRDMAPIDADVGCAEDLPLEVKSPVERRADTESAAIFVPPDELESFIRRVGPLYSTQKINQFANRIKMHPSIIIGQLKHRGEIGHSAHNKNPVPVRDNIIKAAITDGWGKTIDPGGIL